MNRSGHRRRIRRVRICLLVLFAGMLACLFLFRRNARDFFVDDTRYAPMICAAAAKHGLDPLLVRSLIYRESHFDAGQIGSCGEIGLMQVLPEGAAAEWARVRCCKVPSRRQVMEVELNLEIGCWYLARARKRWAAYKEADALALCQYNAGEKRAARWKPDAPDGAVIPNITIDSTRRYVTEILKRYEQYQSRAPRERYGAACKEGS